MLLALCLTTVSCEDTDALKNDINSLNDRVTALESEVKMLNDNLASLHILLQDGIIITTVENADGVYTLTLSDGTVLKLAEKTEGFANTPLVSVDAEGNWQVSYDNGQTFQPMMQGENKVPAIVADGVTPKFRVSADGCWEISYDNGTTYERVKDEAGNDVKAVYDAGTSELQAFVGAAVSADGSSLVLTLADGTTTVSVPIVPDFFCYFDESVTGEQKIGKGETKTFNLHIKGADQTLVTAPTGWKAVLGEADATTNIAVLTVTAPGASAAATASTKATADNTRDISVLALKGGFATIAKLQVNPIDVTIGGGDDSGDEGEGEGGGTDEPSVVTSLDLSSLITSDMSIQEFGTWSEDKLIDQQNYWFTRMSATTVVSYDATEQALKAANTTDRGAWGTTSFGYHAGNKGVEAATYVLTFDAQSTIVGNGVIGVGVRSADDTKGFRIADKNKGLRNMFAVNFAEVGYQSVSLEIDFTQASKSTSLTDNTFEATEAADLTGITILFFNNLQNASSAYDTYIKNIKLVKK